MASFTINPPLKDFMSLERKNIPHDIKKIHFTRKSTIKQPTTPPPPTSSKSPLPEIPDFYPKRTTSAQSCVNTSKEQQKYQKCIEYLQSQHEFTLSKLHQEVQDLKSENKKLNFKIQLESNSSDGGEGVVQNIVRKTLGNKTSSSKHKFSEELLLQETIKDLQVKLDLSQDTNQHLEKTIKNLNKNLKLLQNGGGGEVSKPEKKKRVIRKAETPCPSPRPTPPPLSVPPLKNEHIEKDKLIHALKDQNKLLLNRIEEQQEFIKKLQFEKAKAAKLESSKNDINNNNNNLSSTNSNESINHIHHSDSRILFNPMTSLPPINTQHLSRSQQNSRSGRAGTEYAGGSLTPRTSRTDISRRTRRKDI